jgi:hypothetical protein
VKVCILQSYIGYAKNVVIDDNNIDFTTFIPNDALIFRGNLLIDDGRSFDHILKLNCIDIKFTIPKIWQNSLQQLGCKGEIPWSKVIPSDLYNSILKKFISEIQNVIPTLNTNYYNTIYTRENELLKLLQPATINVELYNNYINNENVSNKNLLETFKPKDGLTTNIIYDRLSSKTGRLTVSSGPNILTLKKELRNIISSSYSPGVIAYIDFSSLEARTALSVVNKPCYVKDIYTWLKDIEFNGRYERKTMKLAILSALFGAGHSNLEKIVGKDATNIIEIIKKRFCVDELKSKLNDEFSKKSKITNFYGRIFEVDNSKDLISYYIQSTGVDVSLLGFKKIVDNILSKNIEFKPLFVLHDALIVDLGKSGIKEIKKFIRDGIMLPHMSNVYYFSIKRLDVDA